MSVIVKALAHHGNIRVFVIDSTDMVKEAQAIHQTQPTASAAFGRLLTISAMMGAMLKDKDEKLTISINGENDIKRMLVDVNALGHIRGYITNPLVNHINLKTKKLDVAKAIGKGSLVVVKDMGLKTNFTSTVDLTTSEIAEDFANYFTVSEQTPSAVSLGVLVNPDGTIRSAGGIVIQMMPGASEQDISIAEHVVAHLKPASQIFDEKMSPKEVALALFQDVEILSEQQIIYHCNCSEDRIKGALSLIDAIDLKEMIQEDHGANIVCQFCNKEYQFSEDVLKDILKKKAEHVENKGYTH